MTSFPATEFADPRYRGLDTWPDLDILRALLDGQKRALDSVAAALPALAKAADLAAERLRAGGRLIYVAAGSPALMSLADALEIPQTYGLSHDRIVLVFADGEGIARQLNGRREDDGAGARADLVSIRLTAKDCVIATSASGTTRYTLEGVKAARAIGAGTIAIASNPGTALLDAAEVPVLIATGSEVITGSTRMGAATAQKAALNLLSTLMGVKLGHVHDGEMVNLVADNEKLRGRAARIVARVTGVAEAEARDALVVSAGAVKGAILIAAGARTSATAERLLGETQGNVRQALDRLRAGALEADRRARSSTGA